MLQGQNQALSQNTTAIILSSGLSSRMKAPKALLMFDDHFTFLQQIVSVYSKAGISKVVVVVNETINEQAKQLLRKFIERERATVILNEQVDKGRFYSISLGLNEVATAYCFLQNIDNPFVTEALLKKMMYEMDTSANYSVPSFGEKDGHPVLIDKKIINHLLSLPREDRNLRTELQLFAKNRVIWHNEKILLNINTAEEYDKYFL